MPASRPDEQRDADAEQPQPGHHRGAVAGHGIVGPGGRDEHRPGPVGQGQRGEHDAADHHAATRNTTSRVTSLVVNTER